MIENYEADFNGTCSQFVRSMFLDTADPATISLASFRLSLDVGDLKSYRRAEAWLAEVEGEAP